MKIEEFQKLIDAAAAADIEDVVHKIWQRNISSRRDGFRSGVSFLLNNLDKVPAVEKLVEALKLACLHHQGIHGIGVKLRKALEEFEKGLK